MDKITARNDWRLLHLRASMLYCYYKEYASKRCEFFWNRFAEEVEKNDIESAFLVTEAFRLTFKRI
jgi:hypothetical protein